MKNTKEVRAILTAIFCINQTSEHKDEDIAQICDYAFRRLLDANTNLIGLCCIGQTKDELMLEILQILSEETQYIKYLEEYKSQ